MAYSLAAWLLAGSLVAGNPPKVQVFSREEIVRELPTLIRDLDSSDPGIRRNAVSKLATAGPEAKPAVPALLRLLKRDDKTLDERVLHTLGSVGPAAQAALPAIAEYVHSGQDANARQSALCALLQITGGLTAVGSEVSLQEVEELEGHPRTSGYPPAPGAGVVAGTVADALADKDSSVRAQAASILGQIGPEAKPQIQRLVPLLQDPELEVRVNTAVALWRIDGQTAGLPVLIAALKRPLRTQHTRTFAMKTPAHGQQSRRKDNAWVRTPIDRRVGYAAVLDSVAEMGAAARQAAPVITDLLTHAPEDVNLAAARALWRITHDAGVLTATVTRLLHEDDGLFQTETLLLVQEIGEKAGPLVPPLLDLLKSETGNDLVFLVKTIGWIGPDARAAIPLLTDIAKDKDPALRWSALTAIRAIDPSAPVLVPALIEMLNVREYRPRAMNALRRLGSRALAAQHALKALRDRGDLFAAIALLGINGEAQPFLEATENALQDPARAPGAVYYLSAVLDEPDTIAKATPLAPSLEKLLSPGSLPDRFRWLAAVELAALGPATQTPVPILVEAMHQGERGPACYVAARLTRYRRNAKELVPALTEMLKSNDRYKRIVAADLLDRVQRTSPTAN